MKRYAVYRTAAAPASRSIGALALALAVTAFLAKRFGLSSADVFVLSLITAAVIALMAVAMAVTALQRIWTYGGRGIPSALCGLIFGGLALVPPALVLTMLVIRPEAEDLSTDLGDPPDLQLRTMAGEQPFLNWLQDAAADRVWPVVSRFYGPPLSADAGQEQLYPDIVSRRYRISPAQLHAAGEKAFEELGWRVVDELPPDLLDAPTRLQAEGTTQILGLKHDVVMRIRPDPLGALLDVRARSRTPLKDLSGNPDHIRTVFTEIDRVLLETYGDLARLSVEEANLGEEELQPQPLQEPRDTIPQPGFKPYIEGEDEPVADDLGVNDLEG